MLPDWLIPNGHFSLAARQQAEKLAEQQNRTLEDCVPDCVDPDRLADSCTIQRWLQRRTESLILCFLLWLPQPPTLLAWDWKAASRILIPQTKSP